MSESKPISIGTNFLNTPKINILISLKFIDKTEKITFLTTNRSCAKTIVIKK